MTKTLSRRSDQDELVVAKRVAPFAAGSSYDGGGDDVVVLSPKWGRLIEALEEPVPVANKSEEGDDKDKVPLVVK